MRRELSRVFRGHRDGGSLAGGPRLAKDADFGAHALALALALSPAPQRARSHQDARSREPAALQARLLLVTDPGCSAQAPCLLSRFRLLLLVLAFAEGHLRRFVADNMPPMPSMQPSRP